jgi:hypothetical protein
MAQAVSHRIHRGDPGSRQGQSMWNFCGGQSDTGTGFSPSSSVVPCQCESTVAPRTHISSAGWALCPLVAAVQTSSHTIDMNNNWKLKFVSADVQSGPSAGIQFTSHLSEMSPPHFFLSHFCTIGPILMHISNYFPEDQFLYYPPVILFFKQSPSWCVQINV